MFDGQPCDTDGPVFQEPWEAQAFAIVLALHEAGLFEWQEWAAALHTAISEAQLGGDADLGNTYYHHWLTALESLVLSKKLTSNAELITRKAQWHSAYEHTPHGHPVELVADAKSHS